jgi:hypothetical protein
MLGLTDTDTLESFNSARIMSSSSLAVFRSLLIVYPLNHCPSKRGEKAQRPGILHGDYSDQRRSNPADARATGRQYIRARPVVDLRRVAIVLTEAPDRLPGPHGAAWEVGVRQRPQ